MDLKNYRTDKELELNGVWFDVGSGTRLLLARWMNPKMAAYVTAKTKEHEIEISQGTLDPETDKRILREGMGMFVCLGWEGMLDGGKDVPYSVETSVKYMIELDDFAELVANRSKNRTKYMEGQKELETKN